MTNKTVPDLKELFKQAAEIAEQVPEIMREAAFNRALDMLTERATGMAPATVPRASAGGEPRKPVRKGAAEADRNDGREGLLAVIDSTQHLGIASASKVLDRALMVLQIALHDHKVDGLSAQDISSILTSKFRVSTTASAARMALDRATNLVNRIPDGKGFLYRIMGPGETYLAHSNTVDAAPDAPKRGRNKAKARKPKMKVPKAASPAEVVVAKGETSPKKSGAKRSAGKSALGPKTAISQLIEAGYFGTARTGAELQEYLQKKKGFSIGADQLRLALLRLVRDGSIERDSNAEGQYEYKKA